MTTPKQHVAREQVYSLAVHDIRRAIETLRPDDLLLAYILRRLAQAFREVAHEEFIKKSG